MVIDMVKSGNSIKKVIIFVTTVIRVITFLHVIGINIKRKNSC